MFSRDNLVSVECTAFALALRGIERPEMLRAAMRQTLGVGMLLVQTSLGPFARHSKIYDVRHPTLSLLVPATEIHARRRLIPGRLRKTMAKFQCTGSRTQYIIANWFASCFADGIVIRILRDTGPIYRHNYSEIIVLT